MKWISCTERLPPLPETPFKTYLVWAVQRWDGATGTRYLASFSKRTGQFLSYNEPTTSRPLEITHWCDALDELGVPDPQPYGPRGKDADEPLAVPA